MSQHPREVLLGAQANANVLPVCDHYSGIPSRMVQSLALQAELAQEFGACVVDVTLDCEDGAPVGREADHAELVADLIANSDTQARIAVRIHPVEHRAFAKDVRIIVAKAADKLRHIMLPKIDTLAQLNSAIHSIDAAGGSNVAIHTLLESPLAIHNAYDIAAHPRVQSISFGLMDFVSSYGGAIPDSAMTLQGQFTHPLVRHAKLTIASACHVFGKTPAHCVVTEFNDTQAIETAAQQAAYEFGYTRMWSIHPSQIRPIVRAFAPQDALIEQAAEIITAGHNKKWAPITHNNRLQDRASYRYYWQVLERAHATGKTLPEKIQSFFTST